MSDPILSRPQQGRAFIRFFFVIALIACAVDPPPPRIDPTPIAELYKRAEILVGRSNLDSAGVLFAQIVKTDSSEYMALLGLAEINIRKRTLHAAIPQLQRAMRAQARRVEAPFQLALVYRMLRRDDEARAMLEEIVEQFPAFTPACMAYADLLMTDAPPSPQHALEQYEAVLTVDPSLQRAQAGAAASRLRLGLFADASRDFKMLLKSKPNDPHLTFLLGTALHWQRSYAEAVTAYKTAINSLPAASPLLPVRLWNLRVAYLAQHGVYPGNLEPRYRIASLPVAAKAPNQFTDIAEHVGVAKLDRGRGVAWADFNGDGDLDLFSVGIQTQHGLFLARNDSFVSTASAAGLNDARGGWAAVSADYDGDGDIDLYVTRDAWEGAATNSLYKNDGTGHFVDVATTAGVDDPDDSFTAAWGDVDGDGWLDLYVADGITGSGAANKLYINDGKGSFADQAVLRAAADGSNSLGVAFGDYDGNGELDLYVANVADPNRLLRNDGKRFNDVAEATGVSRPINGSYVPFFFDSDNDGDLDLFVSAMAYYEDFVTSATTGSRGHRSRSYLYLNEDKRTFREYAAELGIARAFGSMGAGFGDVDNDGNIDIYLANGGPIMPRFEPNALFVRRNDGYVDVAADAGVDNLGKGHGVAFADYDADGDLDLYVGHGGHYPGDLWKNSLYRNEGTQAQWIHIVLTGHPPNHNAIGAQARIYSGDRSQIAQVHSGGGFGSTDSFALEFGLGNRNRVERVEIRWPSGRKEQYGPFDANQVIRITEPE